MSKSCNCDVDTIWEISCEIYEKSQDIKITIMGLQSQLWDNKNPNLRKKVAIQWNTVAIVRYQITVKL